MKEEIEELREYVDRLEEHSHRRKLRLLEQVTLDLSTIREILILFSRCAILFLRTDEKLGTSL